MRLPVKWWVLTHPFVASKAYDAARLAAEIAGKHINDPMLDGDERGGQIDALRHCLWMALLAREIAPRKAEKLGKAHERSNKIDFRKKVVEEGMLPDSISCEMDLRNNKVGILIGHRNPDLLPEDLTQLIREAILAGKLWKLKKDNQGNYLDWNDQPISPENWIGKWNNPRCIVPSNYEYTPQPE